MLKNILFIGFVTCFSLDGFGQCNNDFLWPLYDIEADQFNNEVIILDDQFASEHAHIVNITPGATYTFSSSVVSDFITIRSEDQSEVFAFDKTPVQVTFNNTVEEIRVHFNTDDGCGTEDAPRATSFICDSCPIEPGKVGIETDTPKAELDVKGSIRIGESILPPQQGAIRFNQTSQDFEGYNGENWVSFTKSNGSWGESVPQSIRPNGDILPIVQSESERYGFRLDISGNYAIAGTLETDLTDGEGASSYILKREDNEWKVHQLLNANDEVDGNYFGYNVAISGDVAVVATLDGGGTAGDLKGAIYIYERSGDVWVFQQKIQAADGVLGDEFGEALEIRGNIIYVGAPSKEVSGISNAGVVYMYEKNAGVWEFNQSIEESTPTTNAFFGSSITVFGFDLAVARRKIEVAIFEFNFGLDIWEENQRIKLTTIPEETGFFIADVAMHDDRLVIGVPLNETLIDGALVQKGTVFLYHYDDDLENWIQKSQIKHYDDVGDNNFGDSVDLFGDYIVAGISSLAKAKLVQLNDEQQIVSQVLLNSNNPLPLNFGDAVAISQNSILISDLTEVVNSITDHGNVYFFNRNE